MKKYSIYVVTLLIALIVVLVKQNSDVEEGLESCITNIENKCSGVIEYAIMLEKENARLNKKIKSCD